MRILCPLLLLVGLSCGSEPPSDRPSVSPERLEVVPAQAVIEVGERLVLEARLVAGELANSNLAVTWHSSWPSVASVSPTGEVEGVAPGDAEIWADADGLRASSHVRVVQAGEREAGEGPLADTEPSPPDDITPAIEPAEATPPNQPAELAELSRRSWSRVDGDGWTPAWNDRGLMSVVTDSSAPRACCMVLEYRYPAGFEGGRAPASADFTFRPSRQVFVSTWWKANEGWQRHRSGIDKLLFLFPDTGQGNLALVWYFGGALRVAPQYPGGWDWLEPNVDDTGLRAGRWYRIEWLLEHEAGPYWTVKWWVDGTLRGSHQRVRWTEAELATLKMSPTWGGTSDRKRRDDYFRYAETIVSAR